MKFMDTVNTCPFCLDAGEAKCNHNLILNALRFEKKCIVKEQNHKIASFEYDLTRNFELKESRNYKRYPKTERDWFEQTLIEGDIIHLAEEVDLGIPRVWPSLKYHPKWKSVTLDQYLKEFGDVPWSESNGYDDQTLKENIKLILDQNLFTLDQG